MTESDVEHRDLTILQGAVDNANEAFVTIGEDHRVLVFNKAAEKIFGYGRDEVIGHDLDVIMSPDCARDHKAAVERYCRTKVPRRIGHETEITATRKNGETFPASISFSVSKLNNRLYFTGIVRDLTETKALREQVSRSERLAALGQFVAEITHEIKNPLMMIGGFAGQLNRSTEDPKSLDKLGIIIQEVRRMERLLEDLRMFYHHRLPHKERFDLNRLLEDTYKLLKEDCLQKDVHLKLERADGPQPVEGDPERLKQVFLNLAKNALEATEPGGRITLRSTVRGDEAEITVSDDGCGVSADRREKIFKPFFTTKKQGTGLGLGISKSIVEAHEGSTFTFESAEGKGTTVTVTMPLARTGGPGGTHA
jgi:PAS domain S-box-containing protein